MLRIGPATRRLLTQPVDDHDQDNYGQRDTESPQDRLKPVGERCHPSEGETVSKAAGDREPAQKPPKAIDRLGDDGINERRRWRIGGRGQWEKQRLWTGGGRRRFRF